MSQVDDQELVLQLQEGSLDALGELYDRHRQMVFRTALAITGDQDAACDLLQDYRMTTNLTYTWVKRNNRWMHSLEDVAEWLVGTGKNMPHEVAEKRDDWDQVQRAVSTLPLPQRVVIVLYYLNDLSLSEISDILEVPEGTIKSRLYYGRLALKKSLGLALYGEGEKLPELNYERP
jgi:RNA polymerase sigma-70 factor (ECF subfamily)